MRNIVYFFFDELRQDALSCYKAGMLSPNIQEIASSGTVYDNAFCNSPVCVPSRASLLTSLYPEDTGIYDNEAAMPGYNLDDVPDTFLSALKENGYVTASFGKTHIPKGLDQFDVNNGEGGEMSLGLTKKEKQGLDKLMTPGAFSFNAASLYPEGKEYYPERVSLNAVEWMKRQDKPFFIRLSYLQPHSPIIVKRGFEKLYQDHIFRIPRTDPSKLSEFERCFGRISGFEKMTDKEKQKALCYYYGLASWADSEVGRVLSYLKTRDDYEDLVIIVNADHGALRGELGGAVGKHTFNRQSQAVPLIISTERDSGERHDKRLCSNIDLAPTLFGLLGVPVPEAFKGQDLNKETPDAVYGTIGYGEAESRAYPMRDLGLLEDGSGWPRRSCIRKGRFRLDLSVRINGMYTDESNEDLFFTDTERCPDEDVNMKDYPEYQDEARELRTLLRAHVMNAKEVDKASLALPEGTARQSLQ